MWDQEHHQAEREKRGGREKRRGREREDIHCNLKRYSSEQFIVSVSNCTAAASLLQYHKN